jgi:hypothetical protein
VLVSEALDRTLSEWLYPAGVDRPAFDILASTMTASTPAAAGTFTVEGKLNMIPPDSILEIGSELVATKDVTTTTVTVAERGWMDSVAAAHAIGDQVRVDPKYPRKTLLSHLASIIGMLKPWGLYVRATDATQTFSTRGVITLPAGGKRILSILVRASGSEETYARLKMEGRDWVMYPEFDPPKYQIRRGIGGEGAAMTVIYTSDFTPPTTEADNLDTLGVPTTLQPYLPLGVAGFALQSREIPRVQVEEIRRMLAATGVQVGQALNVGQTMLNAFRYDYVFAERRRQSETDPVAFAWARNE